MKFDHVAALALVGWYLVACDSETMGLRFSTFDCHIQHSFDTAAECEKAREVFAVDQRKLVQQAQCPQVRRLKRGSA
jgi:hypothetical protein